MKLKLNSMLKWNSNTADIYKKSMSKMSFLSRMKILNLEPELILYYHLKKIIPLTLSDSVVPIRGGGLRGSHQISRKE